MASSIENMHLMSSRPTLIRIATDRLKNNLQQFKAVLNPTKILAVVKANAYGHGIAECGLIFEAAGVDYLGVAYLEEGLLLRKVGVKIPILVFGGILGEQVEEFLKADLDMMASSVDKLTRINEVSKKLGKRARVHLKIDTGMERIGQHYYTADKLIDAALTAEEIELCGVSSHFACADAEDLSETELQLKRFEHALKRFTEKGARIPTRHIANTAAALRLPQSRFEMVRLGIGLYGVSPGAAVQLPAGVQPALELISKVVFFKIVKKGAGVSYGHTWHAPTDTRVITIPIGYGDGIPRRLSNKGAVLVHGQRYPIVGTICMDQLMVNIGTSEAFNGDEVCLIGTQGKEGITVDEIAHLTDTIPYEILTALIARIPRVYV